MSACASSTIQAGLDNVAEVFQRCFRLEEYVKFSNLLAASRCGRDLDFICKRARLAACIGKNGSQAVELSKRGVTYRARFDAFPLFKKIFEFIRARVERISVEI